MLTQVGGVGKASRWDPSEFQMMLHVLKSADCAIWMLVTIPLLDVSVAKEYHMPSYWTMH